MMQAVKLSKDANGNVLVNDQPYQKRQIPASGNPDQRTAIARQHTDEIKAMEDSKRVLFVQMGWKTYWFDQEKEWSYLGYSSLDDWIAGEDLTPNAVHYGVQVIDTLHFFFKVDLDTLAKIGRKKFEIILPEIEAIKSELIAFTTFPAPERAKMERRAFWLVNRWINDALGLPATSLKDLREQYKGWGKLATTNWTKHDLCYKQERVETTDEETGEVVSALVDQERTASELLSILLGEKLETVQMDETLRFNAYGRVTPEESKKRPKLTDDRVNWDAIDNDPESDMDIMFPDMAKRDAFYEKQLASAFGVPASVINGDDVLPPFDPSVERVMYSEVEEQQATADIVKPFCCRCKTDFEVALEPTRWRMGEMRDLSKAPKAIRDRYKDWQDHPNGHYLCGPCYYDLTDDD